MRRDRQISDRCAQFALEMRRKPTRAEALFHNAMLIVLAPYATAVEHQRVIGPFIADFRIKSLIVEIDGGYHAETVAYDSRRTAYLKDQGYTVMRFGNNEVFANADHCARHVLQATGPHQLKSDAVLIEYCPPGSALPWKRKRRK